MKSFVITITLDCPDEVSNTVVYKAAVDASLPFAQPREWGGFPVPLFANVELNVTQDGKTQPLETGASGYLVRLTDCGNKKIQVINQIRAWTNLGLKEAKDLADKAGGYGTAAGSAVISKGMDKRDAEQLRNALEAQGATAIIERG